MRSKAVFLLKPLLALAVMVAMLAVPHAAHAQGAYVVQPGDTLYSIAVRHGTSVQAIMSANGLSNANFIWVGQRLAIPGSGTTSGGGGGGVHVVQWGETLGQIAARYGTTVSAIMSANGLSNANYVYAGQRLVISGAASTTRGGGTAPAATGGVHVVQRGETLYSIAVRYGTSVAAISAANGLSNPNMIYVGQRLRVSGAASSGSSSGGTSGGSSGSNAGKWFEIDLSAQRMYAKQGDTVVRTMIVSTGISRYPTPVGRFRIYSKYPSITMSGPGYHLPGVPHSMFFYKGYAIHGTYWHNNFGRPMSHGCVNLTRGDAAWAYSWAPIGTLVVVHQ